MRPSDPYFVWDVFRVIFASLAIIGGCALTRFSVARWRQHHDGAHPDRPHPATFLSYALCLFLLAGDRLASIGQPLNIIRILAEYAIVVLGGWGLGSRYMYVRRRDRREGRH